MAFGVMSKKVFNLLSPDIFDTLLKNSVPKGKESDDAETRKFAIKSLSTAVKTCDIRNVSKETIRDAIEVFYRALNDYQIDRRGDVGSWVREEAMWALKDIIALINQGEDNSIKELRTYLGAD